MTHRIHQNSFRFDSMIIKMYNYTDVHNSAFLFCVNYKFGATITYSEYVFPKASQIIFFAPSLKRSAKGISKI